MSDLDGYELTEGGWDVIWKDLSKQSASWIFFGAGI